MISLLLANGIVPVFGVIVLCAKCVTNFHLFSMFKDCVKTKALSSVLAVRKVTREQAIEAVERVFPKCYADLEPIGRRIRRNSTDMQRAYMEGPMYGYDV